MPLYNWDLGIYVHLLISQIVLNFISTLKIFSLYFYLSQNLSIGNDNILTIPLKEQIHLKEHQHFYDWRMEAKFFQSYAKIFK